jgi:hypothetical protein
MAELFKLKSVNENRQIAADKATIAADMLKDAWIALDDLKALEDLPLSFGHLIQVACSSIVDAVNTVKQLRAELPALPVAYPVVPGSSIFSGCAISAA